MINSSKQITTLQYLDEINSKITGIGLKISDYTLKSSWNIFKKRIQMNY
jgi:hypothetical protein